MVAAVSTEIPKDMDAVRYLQRSIPVCPQHGPMKQYGRDPRNVSVRYYKCDKCGLTAKGLTREV